MSGSSRDTVEQELWKLTRQVRAAIEWLGDSGVEDLPRSDSSEQLLRLFALDPPRSRSKQAGAGAVAARPIPSGQRQRAATRGKAAGEKTMPTSSPTRDSRANLSERAETQAKATIASSSATSPGSGHATSEQPEKRSLPQVKTEVQSCTRCTLHAGRTQTVFARGNPQADLMFIGEGPGFNEDQQGLPFVGKAGKLLDKMIVAMGFSPEDVYITNVVKCRPPDNRKPEEDEIASCTPYLREQIEIVAPRMLVALGATGIQGLLGTRVGITRLRGHWKLYDGRIPIMPTFHPAYLLRRPEKKREVWSDLKQVMSKLNTLPKPLR